MKLGLINTKNEKSICLQKIGKNEWRFVYGKSFNSQMDIFDNACDLLDNGEYEKASTIFQYFMNEVPEFVDSYNHLALISSWKGQAKKARVILEEGITKTMTLFPNHFFEDKNRLEWGWIENRPFLRSYANLGLFYFENKSYEDAKFIFERILVMNPNDNQGLRDPLLNCYIRLGLINEANDLCNQYRQDCLVSTVYGRVLVLYLQGKYKDAERQLMKAIRHYPLVAKELIKSKHIKPENFDKWPGIALGSPEEAYEYWLYYGKSWKSTLGAIKFVKKYVDSVEGNE